MKHATITMVLAFSTPLAHAAGIEIEHEPLTCVPADRFVTVVAKGSPAERVSRADLEFRVDPASPWYSTSMELDRGEWSGVLPRATATLRHFEYRISMAGLASEASASPTIAVNVVGDASNCDGRGRMSVGSSIVVRVPRGAPVVPPVPEGFNPAGVVAAQEREPAKSKKTLLALGGVGAVGAAVGLAVAGSSGAKAPRQDIPDFAFNGTSPYPESTISVSRGALQVFVLMSREPVSPLNLSWRVEWRQSASGAVCVSMSDVFNGAQRPTGLLFTAPLAASGACGARFDVSTARITIQVAARVVWDVTLTLPFSFEP
jgi:hypothetical protein